MLCKKLNLLSDTLVAIDGSKFKAVNSRDRNFTRAKMRRRLEAVESSIERYLERLAEADQAEPVADDAKALQEKVAKLKQEMARLKKLEVRMLNAPDKQLSLTDPDARSMKSRGTGLVGYNVQSAVDSKNHLIIAHQVSNVGNDRRQLSPMAKAAKAVLGTKKLKVWPTRATTTASRSVLASKPVSMPICRSPRPRRTRPRGTSTVAGSNTSRRPMSMSARPGNG